ncbi:MAG: hypothetical protein HYR76_04185 [Ignavibacteria bacterium]|nr:hypothetical protein [Ignavibacteria bacterium]
MKTNKIVFWLLVILVVGTWGAVTYRIVEYSNNRDTEISHETILEDPKGVSKEEKYSYEEDIRDPFHFVKPVRRDSLVRNVAARPKPVWSPPPFKLTGILVTKKAKTATLEGQNGSVFFLHKGDTLSGMKVVDIQEQVVTYYYQKKKDKWVLQ